MDKHNAVIFDIDGTISDSERCAWHSDLIAQGDWSWFKEIARDAPAIEETVRTLQSLVHAGETQVILLTARQESFRELTIKWLVQHGIPADIDLWMRPPAMNGWPDWQFKLAQYQKIRQYCDVVATYDDKPEICKLWEILGVPTVIQVTHNRKDTL